MATNLALDPALLDRAFEVGGYRTKKETVTIALREFIQRRNQRDIVEIIGAGHPDDVWEYERTPERGIRLVERDR